jgi:TAT (twin-arginine translocation) pathway signal sequence
MRHMLLRDWVTKFSRRGFLRGGAATVAAIAVGGTKVLAAPAEAAGLTAEESRSLLKFTRDLFPHDRLDDSFYAKAIAPLQDEASKDAAARKLLSDGIAQLNAATMASAGTSAGKPYADVADENVRVAAIKKIEGGAFFTKVYGGTMTPLYNQPELWAKFGYEGPSSAQGGYLHRGFSDIDWL